MQTYIASGTSVIVRRVKTDKVEVVEQRTPAGLYIPSQAAEVLQEKVETYLDRGVIVSVGPEAVEKLYCLSAVVSLELEGDTVLYITNAGVELGDDYVALRPGNILAKVEGEVVS